MKIVLSVLIIFNLSSCLGKHNEVNTPVKEVDIAANMQDQDNTEEELIGSILNLPRVLKFSKTRLVEKDFSYVTVVIESENDYVSSESLKQSSLSVKKITDRKLVDLDKEPCYVFEKLDIKDNKAFVLVSFNLTGAFIKGNLNLIDGKWIPDENLVIGVR